MVIAIYKLSYASEDYDTLIAGKSFPLKSKTNIFYACLSFRKFRKRSFPAIVRIDSGWNCTPSITNSSVSGTHNLTAVCPCSDFKAIRHALLPDEEGMVSCCLKRVRQAMRILFCRHGESEKSFRA